MLRKEDGREMSINHLQVTLLSSLYFNMKYLMKGAEKKLKPENIAYFRYMLVIPS
jgi:hypothetical protein